MYFKFFGTGNKALATAFLAKFFIFFTFTAAIGTSHDRTETAQNSISGNSYLSGTAAGFTGFDLSAGLAAIAALMMWLPMSDEFAAEDPNACSFNITLAVSIALAIGFLGGLVGQGGSFILIPLMLYVLRLPTRVVIGSNLALVFLASLAGFVGKAATGQVPLLPAVLLMLAAVPGAQIGSVLSHRTRPRWLRTTLAIVIGLAAAGMIVDVLGGGLAG